MHAVSCPQCGKGLKVRDELLGQRVLCPACKKPLQLPAKLAKKSAGWYYASSKQKKGPVSLAELRSLFARKILKPDDLVLPEQGSQWMPLRAALGQPKPKKRQASLWPWLMAACLVLGLGVGGGAWWMSRPAAIPSPGPQANNEKPPIPEEKKPAPPEEAKPLLSEEKKQPEEKKPDPPEEKQPTPPEEKKPDPPEEKKPQPVEKKDLFALAPVDLAKEAEKYVDDLNRLRSLAGLGKVAVDEERTPGCQKHAEYLVRNRDHASLASGKGVLNEEASLPGYSDEGKAAALRAMVAFDPPGKVLEAWLARVPQRLVLLQPQLHSVGLGMAKNNRGDWACVLDPKTRPSTDFVLYPFPQQKEVPLSFSGGPEAPNPKAQPGFPISVQFPASLRVAEAQAWLEDDMEKPVPFWISTPETPLRPNLKGLVGLLPKEPLRSSAKYSVKVAMKVNGEPWEKTWTFSTEDDSDSEGFWAKKILDRLNQIRKDAHLPEVQLDKTLSKGCRLHSLYLVKNVDHPAVQGLGGHEEDPKLPGATPEGKKAGKNSVIAFADATPLQAVDAWLGTLYHRLPMLDTRLTTIGVGAARQELGVDHHRRSAQRHGFQGRSRQACLLSGGEPDRRAAHVSSRRRDPESDPRRSRSKSRLPHHRSFSLFQAAERSSRQALGRSGERSPGVVFVAREARQQGLHVSARDVGLLVSA